MITSLLMLIVWIIIIGLVLGLLIYAVDQMPMFPPGFKQMARVLITVVGIIIIILLLLNFLGMIGPVPVIANPPG